MTSAEPANTSEEPAPGEALPGPREEESATEESPDVIPAWQSQIAEIADATHEIAGAADRYHARAEQREGVIDHLRSELETLRQGERRGLLRPVLAEMCRLRDDLVKQSATLPADFDAAQSAKLLRSYAETIALTLEDNGVVTFTPDSGQPFNPRMHRRVGGEPNDDPDRVGLIGAVKRDGYLDIESNSPIAPAEVTVFTAPPPETSPAPETPEMPAADEAAPTTGDQET